MYKYIIIITVLCMSSFIAANENSEKEAPDFSFSFLFFRNNRWSIVKYNSDTAETRISLLTPEEEQDYAGIIEKDDRHRLIPGPVSISTKNVRDIFVPAGRGSYVDYEQDAYYYFELDAVHLTESDKKNPSKYYTYHLYKIDLISDEKSTLYSLKKYGDGAILLYSCSKNLLMFETVLEFGYSIIYYFDTDKRTAEVSGMISQRVETWLGGFKTDPEYDIAQTVSGNGCVITLNSSSGNAFIKTDAEGNQTKYPVDKHIDRAWYSPGHDAVIYMSWLTRKQNLSIFWREGFNKALGSIVYPEGNIFLYSFREKKNYLIEDYGLMNSVIWLNDKEKAEIKPN